MKYFQNSLNEFNIQRSLGIYIMIDAQNQAAASPPMIIRMRFNFFI